ncbi:FadR/GntR family transcriptional regulator [Streptomyces sp. HNM0574]|uniref:FadR/GntR family transcriptional regulator n=1 Tax=Streptomyces sp. HNM0574 TaxID=2714954 RepID=UPI00146E882E|nr:FadR/GntR family transcriptional regulator [Streptomyces sp. HNM0574]NLU69984.1 FadR family transcriptional regulator [Streptomyces sp. HNM0574]
MAAYRGRGVHGKTVEDLGTRIVSGRMPEGHTLDLAALETELDVSLTALREALKVLAAKGLVDARQRRGTYVTPRGRWNLLDADVMRWEFAAAGPERGGGLLRDLAEVRAAVEPACARSAALRRTEADLEALDGALAAMAAAYGDPARAVEADLAFHRALFAASHNELLARMDLFIEAGLAQRDRLVHAAPHEDPVPVHRAVLDAVRARDPEAAESAVRRLLAQARRDETRRDP